MRAQDAIKEAAALRRMLIVTGVTSLASLLAATLALSLSSPPPAPAQVTAPAAVPVIAAEPASARLSP